MFWGNNDVVIQSNPLIGAHYDLPLAEQQLILTIIARIQPDDEDFKCSSSRLKIDGLAIIPFFGSNYLQLKIRPGSD
jgi:hypothetical protein